MKRITNFYFTFAGKRSDQMGVLCTSMPTRQHPVLRGDKTTIPGRSGFVFYGDGAYDPITIKQEIVVRDNARLPAVLNWLKGAGDLIFSDDPDYAYDAMLITTANRTSPSQHLEGQKIPLTFTCQPFRHEVVETPIVLTSGGTFNGKGHEKSLPLVKVEGSGACSLTINLKTINLTLTAGTPLFIDCDAGMAFTMDGIMPVFAGTSVQLVDDWYMLNPATTNAAEYNLVSYAGSITKITITPRWRFF